MHSTSHRAKIRRGAIVPLVGVSMTAVMFTAALAIDSTHSMADRRNAQNCCDAAAVAGSIKASQVLSAGGTPTTSQIQAAVNAALSQNGFTNGTNCTVTVNYPPTSGNFQNTASVEVLLSYTRNNLVISGSNQLHTRAVSSCQTSSAPAFPMLILDSAGADAFWVNGGSFTLGTASVQVNSKNANAAVVNGLGNSVANVQVYAVGGSSGNFNPGVGKSAAPMSDPYASLPLPSIPSTTYTQSTYTPNGSGNIVLNPGYYPNGIYISSGNVTLNPGLYYIANGNCWINTPGSVTGNGVTMYQAGPNSNAQLMKSYGLNVGFCLCITNNNYTITAPTTGPYAGISLWQGPNCTAEAFYDFWGTGALNVGIQYFPQSTLRCWSVSQGGTIYCNELVCRDYKLLGTHEIYGNSQNGGFSTLTWHATRASYRPLSTVFLAE